MRFDPVDQVVVLLVLGLLRLLQQIVDVVRQLVRLRRAADRRRDQHQLADALGVREREIDREAAALRAADEIGLLDAEPVQHRAQVLHVGEGLRLVARLAEAAPVV